jgi:hypothetical protein
MIRSFALTIRADVGRKYAITNTVELPPMDVLQSQWPGWVGLEPYRGRMDNKTREISRAKKFFKREMRA